jgi:hypothetical protein
MTGALLKVEPSLQHPSGTMEIDIDASSIKPGIYVLTVNVNDDRITQKIIIH